MNPFEVDGQEEDYNPFAADTTTTFDEGFQPFDHEQPLDDPFAITTPEDAPDVATQEQDFSRSHDALPSNMVQGNTARITNNFQKQCPPIISQPRVVKQHSPQLSADMGARLFGKQLATRRAHNPQVRAMRKRMEELKRLDDAKAAKAAAAATNETTSPNWSRPPQVDGEPSGSSSYTNDLSALMNNNEKMDKNKLLGLVFPCRPHDPVPLRCQGEIVPGTDTFPSLNYATDKVNDEMWKRWHVANFSTAKHMNAASHSPWDWAMNLNTKEQLAAAQRADYGTSVYLFFNRFSRGHQAAREAGLELAGNSSRQIRERPTQILPAITKNGYCFFPRFPLRWKLDTHYYAPTHKERVLLAKNGTSYEDSLGKLKQHNYQSLTTSPCLRFEDEDPLFERQEYLAADFGFEAGSLNLEGAMGGGQRRK